MPISATPHEGLPALCLRPRRAVHLRPELLVHGAHVPQQWHGLAVLRCRRRGGGAPCAHGRQSAGLCLGVPMSKKAWKVM